MLQTERIEGNQIFLRPMTQEDTGRIIAWRNQNYVRSNFIYRQPFTVAGHQEWIRTMIDTGKAVQFVICEKLSGGRPVGSTYLRDIDRDIGKAEYGIFIGEADALGRGYGTEAALLMTDYAFGTLKLHKVFLRYVAKNAAAARSYEKAGFFREAYLRDEIRTEGVYEDIVMMASINKEKD